MRPAGLSAGRSGSRTVLVAHELVAHVLVAQGEIWWAELPDRPSSEWAGSEPGFRRPVLVVQGEPLNRSRLATTICVALTTDLRWADAPGNVLLPARLTGLPRDSVAHVSQLATLDKSALVERTGKLPKAKLGLVLAGIDIVLGR